MNGYSEGDYLVEQRAVIGPVDKERTVELRVWRYNTVGPSPTRLVIQKYISIQGQKLDLLLMYDENHNDFVEPDWNQLVAEPEMDLTTLRWDEKISWHASGYRRNGAYVMY